MAAAKMIGVAMRALLPHVVHSPELANIAVLGDDHGTVLRGMNHCIGWPVTCAMRS